ncbi:sugar phosphate isomerase/epimerase [Roseiconus nitratireducens]|uniref:Sugar phosphate isomerase/epimerase n=1 Tax=Roseiconus nitratireducens TaxID=2605748 RepID=A0A5M6D2V2_9BACT|nr:sugar phosphate isomerase/epimerase family protein [Roseiconus nitratireducens]KAA5541824.1 sugar phosphate isomerase/epimerase [Roseiconus nitratireducens]
MSEHSDGRLSRRVFCAAAGSAAIATSMWADESSQTQGEAVIDLPVFKAVKVSMIRGNQPLLEKFLMAKKAGFDGISLFAPDQFDVDQARQAQKQTGLMIHNVNNAVHWKQRLSDRDPAVRQQSLDVMLEAIRFAHAVGASSILQVVGKVTDPVDENHDQVWRRSIDAIRKALPLASKLGVRILCENVGNGFCEHPQQWADYLDEIGDPWVGAFFDIGNHHSKGGADVWIRTLGERIVKLDAKGHDSQVGKNCNLFEGDIDWAAVRTELRRIRFTGWATAEVQGGDEARLREVVERMDRALGPSGLAGEPPRDV